MKNCKKRAVLDAECWTPQEGTQSGRALQTLGSPPVSGQESTQERMNKVCMLTRDP